MTGGRLTRRLHLTAARAFRSAARENLDILFALYLLPRRRQVRRDVGRSSAAAITPEKRKMKREMPMTARIIAAVIGIFLVVCGAIAFFAVRPLRWESVGIGVGAAGLGADLLTGAVRGRWPASALIWLDFPMGR